MIRTHLSQQQLLRYDASDPTLLSDTGTDMFYDLPDDVDQTDATCFQYYGVHTHQNWAATK